MDESGRALGMPMRVSNYIYMVLCMHVYTCIYIMCVNIASAPPCA